MTTLDISSRKFSLANALVCATASARVYTGPNDLTDDATDTACDVIELPECYLVVVRGTRSLRNFVLDVEAWPECVLIGGQMFEVHAGFARAYRALRAKVRAALQVGSKPVFYTGHSLGGSIAVLLAVEHAHEPSRQKPFGVYTFGQPRVGRKPFALFADEQIGNLHFHFVDSADAIARLPGRALGYHHSGQEMFLPELGGMIQNPRLLLKIVSDWWALWSARNRGVFFMDVLLADHHAAKYVEKLAKLAADQTLKPIAA